MKIITIFALFLLVLGITSQAMELPSADLPRLANLATLITAKENSRKRPASDESDNTGETVIALQEYSCKFPKCTYKSLSIKDLELHVWRHLNLKPYQCHVDEQCKKSFDVERNLQSHLAKEHRMQARSYCTKLTLEDRKNIKKITASYLPAFDFICKKCDQAFESELKLDGHRCRRPLTDKPEKKLTIKWSLK